MEDLDDSWFCFSLEGEKKSFEHNPLTPKEKVRWIADLMPITLQNKTARFLSNRLELEESR